MCSAAFPSVPWQDRARNGFVSIQADGQISRKNRCSEMVRLLAQCYIKKRIIMLVVMIASGIDMALQEMLTLAKTYDPTRERPVGVRATLILTGPHA